MNELSIVLPCVSTIEPLSGFIDKLALYLMSNPSEVDVIVVANEEVSSVGRLVHSVHRKYPWLKFEVLVRAGHRRDYGALARFGIAYSTSRYVVLLSPYGYDDFSIITPMLHKIRKGFQVIQAISELPKADRSRRQVMFTAYRLIYRFLAKTLIGVEIRSATNSFKMFDRVFVQALGITQNGYSICPEITFKVLLAGGAVEYFTSNAEVAPIDVNFKLWKEGINYFRLLIRGFLHRIGLLWF